MASDSVHWTAAPWLCPKCNAFPGKPHASLCLDAQVKGEAVWYGPPITPGMLPRLVAANDVVAGLLKCSHCENHFKAGEVIFENRHQAVAIHADCVVEMVKMIPGHERTPQEIDEEYEQRLAEIRGER